VLRETPTETILPPIFGPLYFPGQIYTAAYSERLEGQIALMDKDRCPKIYSVI
jgi:hypothetical protein